MSDELQQLADDVPAEDSQQTNETTGDEYQALIVAAQSDRQI